MKKHIIILVALFLMSVTAQAQMGGGMMMQHGQDENPDSAIPTNSGEGLFEQNCARCHFNGGNVMNPDLPVEASAKLSDFKTFLIFIRHPTKPNGEGGIMPAFTKERLSDQQVLLLYKYAKARYGVPKP